ncbi:MAG: hypothetical protein Barrevirus1_24 [Barrevirus sp.]|uniref:Uncharacterized protein n=1 Tax=Barrevirus sp. TaxID=2487763 RepID=A0A3G4ZPG9_9VIRU|nr:MAG: hypothetical protein Barrevirus1_24 [Barrevirus sp.]
MARHSRGSNHNNRHNKCHKSKCVKKEEIVGAYAGSYFLPGPTQLLANVAFNAGGTLTGQDVGDVGVGAFGTVHTGIWERVGGKVYKFSFTNVGANFTPVNQLPAVAADRLVACGTLTLSNDGQSFTGSGIVNIYTVADPPFSTLVVGNIPFTANFVRLNFIC